MRTASVRELALPFYHFMKMLDGETTSTAMTSLKEYLSEQKLEGDIKLTLCTDGLDGKKKALLSPASRFGDELLSEIRTCAESMVPCPPDMHDFTPGPACKWCGALES